MIDKKKYAGHTKGPWSWTTHTFYDGFSGLYGPNDEEIIVPQCRNEGDEGATWFEDISDPDRYLSEDSPLILQRCMELEEVVKRIAEQKLRNECDVVEDCLTGENFAEAYDLMIEYTRQTLARAEEGE